MALSMNELSKKLSEAVESLNEIPLQDSEELIRSLETIETLLAQVEQTPLQPLKDTLSLVMNVLLSQNIVKNENMDIKASAVVSITELLRIFAPDAPYNDDQLKEIFLATIPVLDQLSSTEGRAFKKAVSVLDVMSKIRTVMILLDLELECGDALVVEMFRQFFSNIRSNHPEGVFPDMASVMTLVLEDIDDISSDLLSVLLSSVRKENQVTSPMTLKLGEKVFTVSAKKLQSHIVEAVRKGSINIDDYAEIVDTIYQKGSNEPELNSNNSDPKQNSEKSEPAQDNGEVKVITNEPENKDVSESLQPNGQCGLLVPEVNEPVSLVEDKSKDEPDLVPQVSQPVSLVEDKSMDEQDSVPQVSEPVSLVEDKSMDEQDSVPQVSEPVSLVEDKSKDEPDSVPQKSSLKRSPPLIEDEETLKRARLSVIAEDGSSIPTVQEIVETESDGGSRRITVKLWPSKNDNDLESSHERRGVKRSSSKIPEQGSSKRANTREASGSESALSVVPNPLPQKRGHRLSSLIDPAEGFETWTSYRPRTTAPRKPLEKSNLDFLPPEKNVAKSEAEETSGQPRRCRTKSKASRMSQEVEVDEKTPKSLFLSPTKTPSGHGISKRRGPAGKRNKEVVAVVPEDMIEVKSAVKSVAKDIVGDSSGLRRSKRQRRDSNKKSMSSEWRAKVSNRDRSSEPILKRTHVIEKEVASESADLTEWLVGKRIKVWWPLDEVYYEGIVSSYDTAKKKHVVSYADGDQEILNLKRERWEFLESDPEPVEGGNTDLPMLEDSSPIIGLVEEDHRAKLIRKKQAKSEKFESPSKKKTESVEENAKIDDSSSSEQSDEENKTKIDSSPQRVEMADVEASPKLAVATEFKFGTKEFADKLIALSEGGAKKNKNKSKSSSEPVKKLGGHTKSKK